MNKFSFFWRWLSVVTAFSLLFFLYQYLGILAGGGQASWVKILVQESVSVTGGGLLLFVIIPMVRRRPWNKKNWYRRLPLYGVIFLVLSAVHTSWNWGVRQLAFWLLGLGHYGYGVMPLRYLMELPIDIMGLSIMTAAIHGVERLKAAKERELQAARLESSLAQAQVHNLRLQLQPHFLFNALNTISSVMYNDPAAADEILDRLATLLRASLRANGEEVTLRSELELLDAYLGILDARFGERIRFESEVDDTAQNILVPSMLLQPLVENAVRHGNAETVGQAVIRLQVQLRDHELLIDLHDDGPGFSGDGDPIGAGLGLRATAERISLLRGDLGVLEAGNDPNGGFRVTIRFPARESS